ncbi:hypothetical protein ACVWXM_009519 [Bradyrhizobium sp. GM7.3]
MYLLADAMEALGGLIVVSGGDPLARTGPGIRRSGEQSCSWM